MSGDGKARGGRPVSRRQALKRLGGGALGVGAGYALPSPVLGSFLRRLEQGYEWAFLRPGEVETMTALADTLIPADERSGSASDAGTVEYVDFVLGISGAETQAEWREGLRWLDLLADRLSGEGDAGPGHVASSGDRKANGGFAAATPEVRREILDRIAWPEEAPPRLRDYADWFSSVRDLVGAGFFSSRTGVEGLGYMGNVMRPEWEGAPPEVLEELGLSYEEWDRRYGEES